MVKVDLRMNNFGVAGYKRLHEAVKRSTSLITMDLSNSLIESKEQVKAIKEVLAERGPPKEIEKTDDLFDKMDEADAKPLKK